MPRRRLLFQVHLYAGLAVGVVLAVMALSGSVLVFGDELDRWLHPELRRVAPGGAPVSLARVAEAVAQSQEERAPRYLRLWMDSSGSVEVYVDPWSGVVLAVLTGLFLAGLFLTGFFLWIGRLRARQAPRNGSLVPAGAWTPAPTLFGAVLQPRDGASDLGRLAMAVLLAMGTHGAVVLLLGIRTTAQAGPLMASTGGGGSADIAVRFMLPRAPAPSSVSAPSAHKQLASRPALVRRRLLRPSPAPTVPPPVADHSDIRQAPGEPNVESTEAAPMDVARHTSSDRLPGVEAGNSGSGALGGIVGESLGSTGVLAPPPPPPPPLTREQRQALTSGYLQELFRSRIAAHFHYPPEAEHLGLEGLVMLRVSIDRSGQLLEMRVQGGCPHTVLCDAALRTVRESLPFPPPPDELGASIVVDVPFQYRLE